MAPAGLGETNDETQIGERDPLLLSSASITLIMTIDHARATVSAGLAPSRKRLTIDNNCRPEIGKSCLESRLSGRLRVDQRWSIAKEGIVSSLCDNMRDVVITQRESAFALHEPDWILDSSEPSMTHHERWEDLLAVMEYWMDWYDWS